MSRDDCPDKQERRDKFLELCSEFQEKCPHGMLGSIERCRGCMIDAALDSAPSSRASTPTYDPLAAFDKCDGGLPCMATTTGCAKGQCSRRKHAAAMSGVSVSVSYGAGEWIAAKVTGLDALGLGFVEATGRQFAFTFDRIDGYRGERPKEIGLKIGAIVHVLVNDGKVDRLSLKGRPASHDIGESRG